jgi:hypothetical protein
MIFDGFKTLSSFCQLSIECGKDVQLQCGILVFGNKAFLYRCGIKARKPGSVFVLVQLETSDFFCTAMEKSLA